MSKQKKMIMILVLVGLLVLGLVMMIPLFLKEGFPADTAKSTTPSASQSIEDDTKPGQTQPTGVDTTPTTATDPTTETKPTTATNPTTNQNTATEPEVTAPPPIETPPSVDIPDSDDKEGLQFPCEVPGYDLYLEKLASYSGIFVEDGTNAQVSDVAMMMVHNQGQSAVEYTEITVKYADETLMFHISALPAGERMVVQESTGKPLPQGLALEASALVVQRVQMEVAPEISVTDNGNNTLTVKNLTNQAIPAIRVFYKYYMEDEDIFVGGIAFTVRITNLAAGGNVVIQPSHFNSQTSRVVMAQIYDS